MEYEMFVTLTDAIQDTDVALEVYNKVIAWTQNISNEHANEFKSMRKTFEEKFDEYEMKLEQKNKELENIKKFNTGLPLLRQYINILFKYMWDKINNKSSVQNCDFNDLANKTSYMRRKDIVDSDNGTKYALCLIYDIVKDEKYTKDAAEFYIKINDLFHPKIKPAKIYVKNSIKDISDAIKNTNLEIAVRIHLTTSVLDELLKDLDTISNEIGIN